MSSANFKFSDVLRLFKNIANIKRTFSGQSRQYPFNGLPRSMRKGSQTDPSKVGRDLLIRETLDKLGIRVAGSEITSL